MVEQLRTATFRCHIPMVSNWTQLQTGSGEAPDPVTTMMTNQTLTTYVFEIDDNLAQVFRIVAPASNNHRQTTGLSALVSPSSRRKNATSPPAVAYFLKPYSQLTERR
jgi:hypothetical protein